MYWLLAKSFVLVKWFPIVVDFVEGWESLKVLEDLILGLSSKLVVEEEEIFLDKEKREESRRRGCPYILAM